MGQSEPLLRLLRPALCSASPTTGPLVGGRRARRWRRSLLALAIAAWAADYLRGVRRVRLVLGRGKSLLGDADAERLAGIAARCPSLTMVYWPTWYAPGALLQLLLLGLKEVRARLCGLLRAPYSREVCELQDGGRLTLDWLLPQPGPAEGAPVCVLLHGAFMDSQSATMSDLASDLAARGLPTVVMNRRGYQVIIIMIIIY